MKHILWGVFLIGLASYAFAQDRWQDTHRVILRNGDFVDGRLVEQNDEVVVMQWDPGTKVTISRADILRIEEIRIRLIDQPPPVIEQPASKETIEQPVKPEPVKTKPEPRPSPNTPEGIRSRVDEILKRLADLPDEKKEALKEEMRAGGEEGARYLISLVDTLDEPRRYWALRTIETMRNFKIDADLKGLLDSKLSDVRISIAIELGARGAKSAIPQLLHMLKEMEAPARAAAALSLGQLGDASVVEPVSNLLLDEDKDTREQAANGANAIAKRTAGVDALARRWLSMLSRAQAAAKLDILKALIDLGTGMDAATFPVDRVREEMERLAAYGGDANIRGTAAYGLGALRYADAAPKLLEAMSRERDPNVVCRLCDTLASISCKDAVEPLINLLRSDTDRIRAAAYQALGRLTRQKLPLDHNKWSEWFKGQSK